MSIPLEDISTLVLEHQQVVLSMSCLSRLAAQGSDVIVCDETHKPVGMLLPFMPHSRQTKISMAQLRWTDTFKHTAQQLIISKKINNQAHCLHALTGKKHEVLLELSEKVSSGDAENNEARAARYYFNILLEGYGRKNKKICYNNALDYAYAVIRAKISQCLAASGFIPCIGLFHKSELNNFNLSDDMIEPYRALIDYYVFNTFQKDEELHTAQKALIIELLETDIHIEGQKNMSMGQHIKQSVYALQTASQRLDVCLLQFPVVNSSAFFLGKHKYE